MKHRKMVWITAALPLIAAVIAYRHLPEMIPIHWNLSGEIDSTGPRWAILPLGGISIAATVFELAVVKIDPKGDNIRRSAAIYEGFVILFNLFLLSMVCITLVEAMQPGTLDVGRIITVLIGILFAVIGNYMPKLKTNFAVGSRTPWALCNEQNWRKTQRISGWILFIGGIVITIGAFVLPGPLCVVLLLGVVAVWLAATYLVSYLDYRASR